MNSLLPTAPTYYACEIEGERGLVKFSGLIHYPFVNVPLRDPFLFVPVPMHKLRRISKAEFEKQGHTEP